MGGQVTDTGSIKNGEAEFKVESVSKAGALIVHTGVVKSGEFKNGDEVTASIDSDRRIATMRNHSATHLLHKALRMMLGDHVVQAGSLVDPERLRFDFTHMLQVTPGELAEVEKIANDAILRDLEIQIYETTLEQAKSDGAMALFGEKYSGEVRVVKMGDFSMELCGGTHLTRTSQIGLLKITGESSVGAGLRRIEAVTGAGALAYMKERDEILSRTAEMLKVAPAGVPDAVNRIMQNLKAAEKEVGGLRKEGAASQADDLVSKVVDFNGIQLVAEKLDSGDVELMSSLADSLAGKLKSLIVVLAAPSDGKAVFVAKVTPDLVKKGFHAGNLIREVAKAAGGGGGGRPDFAQAGGKDAGKLDEALAIARELIRNQVE
jgi:alanyl-tRNA synthetase